MKRYISISGELYSMHDTVDCVYQIDLTQLILSISNALIREQYHSAHTHSEEEKIYSTKSKSLGVGGGRSAPFGVSKNLKRRGARSARARNTANVKTH
jgi:hypothetical protein